MATDRSRLSATARYCLEILSRGARSYSAQNNNIRALARKGLVELLPDQADDGLRRWAISEAGREALKAYTDLPTAAVPASSKAPRP